MSKTRKPADDETAISEISIAADGRVYVFGASSEVLEVLALLNERDTALNRRVDQIRATQIPPPRVPAQVALAGSSGGTNDSHSSNPGKTP